MEEEKVGIIEYSYRIRVKSQLIYTISLLTVLGVLLAMPFIRVTITVRAPGMIQASNEKTEIVTPIGGTLAKFNLSVDKKVKVGDDLFTIDPSNNRRQGALVKGQITDLTKMAEDLRVILNAVQQDPSPSKSLQLQTGLYSAAWQQYGVQYQAVKEAADQAKRSFDRYQKLYNEGAMTLAEYEKARYENEQAQSDYKQTIKKYIAQWQSELNQYRNAIGENSSRKIEIEEQSKLYTLKSPVNGSIINLAGLSVGSYVSPNQRIAEITPDTQVIAMCLVKPSDIGFIYLGQTAIISADAFNYNQWGVLKAKVIDISDDIVTQEQGMGPLFRVKCLLSRNYLQLKNGYKGYMKKGMTFTARFQLTKRSLSQLLYDKVDNWMNPSITRKASDEG